MSGETQVAIHPPPISLTGVSVSGLHSSGGSTEGDSSGEELHHVVLPKKIRLKESSSLTPEPLISMICHGGGRDRERPVNIPDDEDECSNDPAMKDNSTGHSITSGENSDAEGEDQIGSHSRLKDSSKKMFECDVCNMKFSNGANQRRHSLRHTGIKPFECKICQKRFFRKDHLAEHMATHSKLLPFRCPICNKGFQRQIAMRAHFQNEHVGGSQDTVKACPLCAYKAGSMKALRIHFFSRHGIDLDNPMPHSPSLLSNSPRLTNPAEYSLAYALGFEDREKSNDSSFIPSHFLVPQIEISANSPHPNFPFSADSSYGSFSEEKNSNGNGTCTPQDSISPQSDARSDTPSSSDLVKIVIKKEVERNDDVQEMPEDLTVTVTPGTGSGGGAYRSLENSPKCSSSTTLKLSPLKILLREDWRPQSVSLSGGENATPHRDHTNDTSSRHTTNDTFQNQPQGDGDAISSSNGPEAGSPQSLDRRNGASFAPVHQCIYCGIIFPDKTLYFLHKGCHSEMNPWRCNICGCATNDVYDFNSHLLSKSHQ